MISYASSREIQALTENYIPLDRFYGLIDLIFEFTVAYQPTHTFKIRQKNIKSHNGPHNSPLRCRGILPSFNKIKSTSPLVNRICKMEIDNRENKLLLGKEIYISSIIYFVLSYSVYDFMSLCNCVVQSRSKNIIIIERIIRIKLLSAIRSRLEITNKSTHQSSYLRWI